MCIEELDEKSNQGEDSERHYAAFFFAKKMFPICFYGTVLGRRQMRNIGEVAAMRIGIVGVFGFVAGDSASILMNGQWNIG